MAHEDASFNTEIGEDGKYYYYGNTDWYGYFYNHTRPQMEHNVSITGGGEKVNYYISGRYYQQYGMFNIDKDLYKDYSFPAQHSDSKLPDKDQGYCWHP